MVIVISVTCEHREAAATRCPAVQSSVVHPGHTGAAATRLPRHRRRPYPAAVAPAAPGVLLQPVIGNGQRQHDAGGTAAYAWWAARRRRSSDVVHAASVTSLGPPRTRWGARPYARDSTRSSFRQHRNAWLPRRRGKRSRSHTYDKMKYDM